jgi:glutamyl-tRNA synthetase
MNLLAFLGWNPGTTQEIFSREELVEAFTLDRVSKSGAKFDQNKAKWFNQQYVRHTPDEVLAESLKKDVLAHSLNYSDEYITKVCVLIKEKISFIKELWEIGSYFFVAPTQYDEAVITKRWNDKSPLVLQDLIQLVRGNEAFDAGSFEANYNEALSKNGVSNKEFLQLLRVCLSGVAGGPPIFEMAQLFGKEVTLERLQHALINIKK